MGLRGIFTDILRTCYTSVLNIGFGFTAARVLFPECISLKWTGLLVSWPIRVFLGVVLGGRGCTRQGQRALMFVFFLGVVLSGRGCTRQGPRALVFWYF
jgi:hypothetical protein